MKIKVLQFQSIADATVEPVGFTAITGPTNVGKSALLRAISAILFGLPGDYYIREGSDACAVGMTDGTNTLKWKKVRTGKATPTRQTQLEVNGHLHSKLGRDHNQLTAPLGYVEVETTATRLRPQVAMQHDPIFLLTESDTNVAEVFKMLGRADIVTTAQANAKKDGKSTVNLLTTRKIDELKAEELLAEVANAEDLKLGVEKAELEMNRLFASADSKQKLVEKLKTLITLTPLKLPSAPQELKLHSGVAVMEKIAAFIRTEPIHLPTAPVVVDKTPSSIALIKSFILAETQLEAATLERVSKEESLKVAEADMDQLKVDLGACPTCERPFENHEAHQ